MIFQAFLPEIFLISSVLLQLFFNTLLVKNLSLNFPIITKEAGSQTIFILIILFFLFLNSKVECWTSFGLLQTDAANVELKLLTVFFSCVTVILLLPAMQIQKLNFHEVFSFYLLTIFSLLLILCSQNLLSFYILLETQTICFYILSTYNRKSAFSTEAGLKYFISGSFMSG